MKPYSEVVESFKLGTLHDGVEHGLHDEPDVIHDLILRDIETHERLQEADEHDEQQQEEDQTLAEHDLQNDEHGAEKAERVKVQQQPHPEHGRGEGEEIVAQLVEVAARVALLVVLVCRVRDGDHAEDKGQGEQGVEGAIEHVPEGEIVAADLVELVYLVADEAQGEDVEQAFDDVEISVGVDGVDSTGVQAEVDQREDDLHPVLISRNTHAVRVEVRPEVGVRLVLVLHEPRRVLVVLHNPAAPEVVDGFLVARGANDGHSVEVDGLLDSVGGLGGLAIDEDRVPLKQDLFEEVVHILLGFDDALGHHFGGDGADIVEVGVPQLGGGLLLEPLLHDQQTEDHACRLVFSARARLVRRVQHRLRDDGAVGLGDLLFLELVRDDLLDLVLQAQADLGDLFGVDWRRVHMLAARRED